MIRALKVSLAQAQKIFFKKATDLSVTMSDR